MYVIKRDGRKEKVAFDKITARINKLSYGLNLDFCDPVSFLHNYSRVSNTVLSYHAIKEVTPPDPRFLL